MFNRRLRIFKIPYLSPKDFQIRFVAVPSARIFYTIVSFKYIQEFLRALSLVIFILQNNKI
ncbi:hypothetical protein COK25_29195 [Bacillus cereus]|nr:hypothetical protein CON66_30655 [Bacillus cereus]PEF49340.1 hypothetical protein CON56_27505 [Bacillus thuringiensis]PED40165.1 hypothetical protein CON24_00035 [Bacillus cereus]PEG03994.1 hypothetical protein CON54_15165 [Bacillus cereus]PER08931.1 hypothetical protein CN489_24200 [Bacillus cereus]